MSSLYPILAGRQAAARHAVLANTAQAFVNVGLDTGAIPAAVRKALA